MARRPPFRPGVRLGAVAIIVVVLYAIMAGIGHSTPKLGLDLQGGTTVILTPKTTAGHAVTKQQLNVAVDIIRQRVDGLGVAGAQVVTQGTNVVISVPGKGRNDVLNTVGQTAALTFREIFTDPRSGRPVEQQTGTPPGGTPAPTFSQQPSPSPTSPAPAQSSSSPRPSGPTGSTTKSSSTAAHPRPLSDVLLASPTPSPSPVTSGVPSVITAPNASGPTAAPEVNETTPTAAELRTFVATNCSINAGRPIDPNQDDPHKFITACDRTQPLKYLLMPADLVGTQVSSANATINTTSTGASTGEWIVQVTFKSSAVTTVNRVSSRLYNNNRQPLAITLDGVVVSLPATDSPNLGQHIQISGGQPPFSHRQASDLANALKYGSLPVAFTPSQEESVSASLGKSSLQAGLLAGSLGLALVLVYVFFYYRMLGFVTVASLLVSGLMVYASVTLLGQIIGFTLSLAGIAGLIVAVGITADSFVVFFERLKDEIRDGRSPRMSVEYGWIRARRTIFSADTVSFLAAVILYLVSVGDVKGFAFTLGLSTMLDIFTVLLFTRPVVTLLIRRPLFSTSSASGLSPGRIGTRRVPAEA